MGLVAGLQEIDAFGISGDVDGDGTRSGLSPPEQTAVAVEKRQGARALQPCQQGAAHYRIGENKQGIRRAGEVHYADDAIAAFAVKVGLVDAIIV